MIDIEAGDSLTLASTEWVIASIVSGAPQDMPLAGWSRYTAEHALPSVTRQGERYRKDRWHQRRW